MSLPDGIALCVLVVFLVWSIVGEAVRAGSLGAGVLDDFAFARDLGSQVALTGRYADPRSASGASVVFAYPPPFALLQLAVRQAGPIAGPVTYMAMLALSGATLAWSCLRLLGATRVRLRWVAVLLAVAACRVFVQSDLHHLNSNTLTVSLALAALVAFGPTPDARVRNGFGGLLLACSLAIKPWAAGIIPLLGLLGRARAIGWSLVWIVGLFIVVPAVVVGPRGALELTSSWFAILKLSADPGSVQSIAVDNVSLAATAAALGAEGSLLRLLVPAIQLAWLSCLVGLVLSAVRRVRAGDGMDGRRWLAMSATLLVAPVPMTAIFQPHHAVVAVPLAILVALDALRLGISRSAGAMRLAVLGWIFVLSSYGASGPLRGPFVLTSLALLVGAAWWPIESSPSPSTRSPDRVEIASVAH
jgi:hypothetical protein